MKEDLATRETTIIVVTHRETIGAEAESAAVTNGKGNGEVAALNVDGETIAAAEVKK